MAEEEDEIEEEQRAVYHRFNDDIDEALGISRGSNSSSTQRLSSAPSTQSLNSIASPTQRLNFLVAERLREIVAFGITNAVEIRKILRSEGELILVLCGIVRFVARACLCRKLQCMHVFDCLLLFYAAYVILHAPYDRILQPCGPLKRLDRVRW